MLLGVLPVPVAWGGSLRPGVAGAGRAPGQAARALRGQDALGPLDALLLRTSNLALTLPTHPRPRQSLD